MEMCDISGPVRLQLCEHSGARSRRSRPDGAERGSHAFVRTSSWFLVVALFGLAWTLLALRPFRRPQILGVLTFFGAWLTTELASLLLVGQVIGTIAFITAGALDDFVGWIALGVTVLS